MTSLETRLQHAARELREFDPDPPELPQLSGGHARGAVGLKLAPVAAMAAGLVFALGNFGTAGFRAVGPTDVETAPVVAAAVVNGPAAELVTDSPANVEIYVPTVEEELLLIGQVTATLTDPTDDDEIAVTDAGGTIAGGIDIGPRRAGMF